MSAFPDYEKNIVSLSNSLLKYFGAPTRHQSLPFLDNILSETQKKNVVFLILDCLGYKILNKTLSAKSFLRSHCVDTISSVFPPTTTAATTSFHSGLYPVEHGWVGWAPYFKEYGRVIETFLNRDLYTQEELSSPPVRNLLSYKTIYQSIVEADNTVEYHRVFPAFEPDGVKSFEEMCERIPSIIAANNHKKIISAYWPYPDHDLHRYGTSSPKVRQCVEEIDVRFKQMSKLLKDTLLIISADHGIADVGEIYLNDYPELISCLALPPSLEARCVSLFIKPEKRDFFAKEFKRLFADNFVLLSKEEFLESGLLGRGTPHVRLQDFIGDFVAIGISDKSLRYKSEQGTGFQSFVADHAGLTAEELSVPVIVYATE